MLNEEFITRFTENYVQMWRTADENERAALIEKLFAQNAVHHAAPAGTTFNGRDAILENIANVNKQAIQTAGLKFVSGKTIGNGNAILTEWSARTPDGKTVRSGQDILVFNNAGKVQTLYMFTSD